MVDIATPDLLPGVSGSVVKKRLVDMGDGTFAEMTVTTLATSDNSIGTVNLGSLGGAATAANQAVGNASLLALTSPFLASSTTSLTTTISDTAPHMLGPFSPQIARTIWLTMVATGATGSAQVLRSVDGGTTKAGLTVGGQTWANYAFSNFTGTIVNEPITTETSAAASYFLAVTLSAGVLSLNLHQ